MKNCLNHNSKTLKTLHLSKRVIDNSNDKTSFLHKLLLTDIQVSGLCKVIAIN